jgi:hypothetical protein
MSNGYKAERVVHIFGVQLQDRIVTEPSHFRCFLTAVRFVPISVFNFSEMITLGLVTFSWLCFHMNMDNYPHVTIASLCSTGQHRPGFPRVLYDALRQLGYNGDVPVHRGRMCMAHGQDKCEVNMVIPLYLTEPWMTTVIGVKLDETFERTAQVVLTSLCESRVTDTAAMPIALFLIRNEEDPVWKQCLEAMSNPRGPSLACRHGYIGRVCAVHV